MAPRVRGRLPRRSRRASRVAERCRAHTDREGPAAHRRLAAGLETVLAPEGIAIFELGAGQVEAVSDLFREAAFMHLKTQKDHAGIDRLLFVSRKELPDLSETSRNLAVEAQDLEAAEAINDNEASPEMRAALERALDAYGEDDISR